jgi:hypothetical protein
MTDADANRRINTLLRDRPNRATTSESNAGKPRPVRDGAATQKAALDRVNDAIRQEATRTPWPVPGADDDAGTEERQR